MRTVVVLPEPFGPSSENTVPTGTCRSSPSTARTSPKSFVSPCASMAIAEVLSWSWKFMVGELTVTVKILQL